MSDRELVTLVGLGRQSYREYSLKALAATYRVTAVLAQAPTWQCAYLEDYRIADLADMSAVTEAVRQLSGEETIPAVFTWDETALRLTAGVASRLGGAFLEPEAAAFCRDKYAARQQYDASGLPSVRHRLAASAAEARQAAAEIGYPVVVKPRGLAGSVGVIAVDTEEQLLAAYESAVTARFAGLTAEPGVLIEELLQGPEISIDSIALQSTISCRYVARKRLGFAPGFEEIGHVVGPWRDEPWASEVIDLVTQAHLALGVRNAVTHAEVRLTANGPRLVELNGRLGGDFIPLLGNLSTGEDVVIAAAQLALGQVPRLESTYAQYAEVRFLYPVEDSRVQRITLPAAGQVPGLVHALPLVVPGEQLQLPPRGLLPRWGALIVVGDSIAACGAALDAAEAVCRLDAVPLS